MNKETIQGFTVERTYDGWKFCRDKEQKELLARLPHLVDEELLFHRSMEEGKVYKAQLTLDVSNQDMEVPMKPDYLGDMFKHNYVESTDTKNVIRGWIVRDKAWYQKDTSLTFYLEHPGRKAPFGYGMFWHPMPSEMLADCTPLDTPMKCLLTIELLPEKMSKEEYIKSMVEKYGEPPYTLSYRYENGWKECTDIMELEDFMLEAEGHYSATMGECGKAVISNKEGEDIFSIG